MKTVYLGSSAPVLIVKEFDSRGPRCCSAECERGYRERQSNLAVLAEVGAEVKEKRCCERCGTNVPMWRYGRKVSSATRFCSPKCRAGAFRAAAFKFVTRNDARTRINID